MNKKLLTLIGTTLIFSMMCSSMLAKKCKCKDNGNNGRPIPEFDYVIVGLGTTGSVLASRLSECPEVTVCVIEAGDDYTRQTNPSLPLDNDDTKFPTATNNETFWPLLIRKGLRTYVDSTTKGFYGFNWFPKAFNTEESRGVWYNKGAGWGGNSMQEFVYLRGSLGIYDEWEAQGNTLWNREAVLECFKKAENRTQTNALGRQYFEQPPEGPPYGLAYNLDPSIHGTEGPVDILTPQYVDPLMIQICGLGTRLPGGYALDPFFRDPDNPDWDSFAIPFPTPISMQDQYGTEFAQRNPYNDAGAPYPPNAQLGLANQISDYQRVTAASAYIYPIENQRTNLTIFSNSLATRIIFDGTQAQDVEYLIGGNIYATGRNRNTDVAGLGGTPNDARCNAEIAKANGTRRVRARKSIIIAAGPFNSPQLLMLSGIGPREHLEEFDIDVIQDLPGVGQHLQDHPSLDILWGSAQPLDFFNLNLGQDGYYWALPGFRAKSNPERETYNFQMLSFPSITLATDGGGGLGFIDGVLDIRRGGPPTYTHNLNNLEQTFPCRFDYKTTYWGLIEHLRDVRSQGQVRLRSADPTEYPAVCLNYFEDPQDIDDFANVFENVFMPMVEGLSGKTGQQGFAEVNGTIVPQTVPGTLPLFTEWIWPREDQFKTDGVFDKEKFTQFLRDYVWSSHASGTTKMGPSTDPFAVVDQRTRVHGVSGLRVVGGSISPVIPAAPTLANAYMVGECAAKMIKEDFGDCS